MKYLHSIRTLLVLTALAFVVNINAQNGATLECKIFAHDGSPATLATINILKGARNLIEETFHADQTGLVKISLAKGLHNLSATGVNHASKSFQILIEEEKNYTADIRLSCYEYHDTISELSIIGDFNKFNFRTAKSMNKENDGSFSVVIDWDKDSLAYQIIGATTDNRSINGTQSDAFKYDGEGDYRSVVSVKNGSVKIIYDPKKAVRSDKKPTVSFTNSPQNSLMYELILNYNEWRKKYLDEFQNYKKQNETMEGFEFDFSGYADPLKEKINTETGFNKQLYLIAYAGSYPLGNKDSLFPKIIFKEIPIESPLWLLDPSLIIGLSMFLPDDEKSAKIEEAMGKIKDEEIVTGFLMTLYFSEMDEEKKNQYYERIMNDYPNSEAAKMLEYFAPRDSKIKAGVAVPDFKVINLDEPDKNFSNIDMYGKIYMIDFWATWCGPCIAEMDNLHKAYGLYKDKGFQIISLSFDSSPDDVKKFREKKYKMPWLHSFVDGGFGSELAASFEVKGIPKPILVNKDGTILAVDAPLRGKNLFLTLEKIFK